MDRLEKLLMENGIDISSIPSASEFEVGQNTLKDADTFRTPEGVDVRIQGINARETSKFLPGKIQGSQLGADTQTKLVGDIAREGGFVNPVLSDKKDIYDRTIGDLSNESGQLLSNKLAEAGITELGVDATPDQYNATYMGRLERSKRANEGTRTVADAMLDSLNEERNAFGIKAKIFAPDAKTFGAAVGEGTTSDFFTGPALVREGEDQYGRADSNWSTGIDIGMATMKQGVFGAIDLIGTTTGIDFFKNIGESNVRALQSDLESLPYLKDAEALGPNGEWKLDTLGKMTNYLVGTAASSAPQMVSSIVSVMAAPATFGLSLAFPAATYTGNTWNAQEKKNAGAAILSGITQAALDRLAIGNMFKGVKLDLTSKATQELVTTQLMKKGMSKEVAEKAIVDAMQKSTKEVSDAMSIVAARQQLGIKNIGKRTVEGMIAEGPTEGLQELTQYFGEQGNISLPSTPEEATKLKNRIANAAIGGTLLGGAISGASATASNLTYSDKSVIRTNDLKFREQFKGNVPYAQDVATEALQDNLEVDLDKLAEIESTKRAVEGIPSKLNSWWQDKGISSLWERWGTTIMGDRVHKSKFMGALGTLLGAGNPLNGASITDQQVLVEASIFSNFGTKEELESSFGGMDSKKVSTLLSNPKVLDVMDTIIRAKNNLSAKKVSDIADRFNLDQDLGEFAQYKDGIIQYADRIDNMIQAYNKATGEDVKVYDFVHHKPLDKTLVSRHFSQFVKDLEAALGISGKDAVEIANTVINNNDVNSVEDALDDMLNFETSSLKNRDQLAAELYKPENRGKFARYFSHDIIDNAYSMSARGAAKNVNFNIIGKNGSKLAALIQASLNNGDINAEEASFMAKEIRDFLDMRAGKYHPITNPYIKGALSTINFLSTITMLPLAAVSSTVEFAQVYRNLNTTQSLKATRILLKTFGKEFAALYRDIGSSLTDKIKVRPVEHRIQLSNAGYLREGGIAHRNDILAGYFQKWTEGFFKITGLTSVTAITRHAKLGIAADAINNWLSVVRAVDPSDQAAIDAKEHLIRIGIDVDYMLSKANGPHTPDTEKRIMENFERGAHNLVNEAVVIPNSLNRPKFYSDPYLRLFTQFQGYTSTFTATILPRLLTDLNRKGSSDQANAAATIAMMFAMSMLALYLKDMIKYGESPPEWLDDDKRLQRLINQTGLLGSGQRVWDVVSDITGNDRYGKTVLGDVYTNISNQSPQLTYINKINSVLSATEGTEIKKGARLLPVLGTSPAFANYLQKTLGE